MPTIGELYRMITEHEKLDKSAAVKKTAIQSPQRGSGAPANEMGAVLEDVLGQNIAETKVRIKKKLEEVSGAQRAAEGIASDADDETPAVNQGPIVGDKMPPGGEPSGLAGKAASKADAKQEKQAEKAASSEKQAEDEKLAEEKIAAEYYAAGQIMARGFMDELSKLASAKK